MGVVAKWLAIYTIILIFFIHWKEAANEAIPPTADWSGGVDTSTLATEGIDVNNSSNSTDTSAGNYSGVTSVISDNPSDYCPDGLSCDHLEAECLNCSFNTSCVYGRLDNVTCSAKEQVHCEGDRTFERSFKCLYCYQVEHWLYTCTSNSTCTVISSPPHPTYTATCTVKSSVICMGKREFYKKLRCNWTKGYSWSTTLALSITLGGLGADRFYLGLWRAGLGKLFSFGGLGVWTIVDVILIAIGYIGPSDGTLYM